MKRHIWCVITITAILLLWLFTLSFGKDVNLVSHLSLTSAVVSIVLAVIVIVYMYFQDQRSSQNITEMRNLVDQASRAMTDKADLMADRTRIGDTIIFFTKEDFADSESALSHLKKSGELKYPTEVE